MRRGSSISSLMLATAILAIHGAFLGSALRGDAPMGLRGCLDFVLLPGVSILAMVGFGLIVRRVEDRPFALGFAVTGVAAIVVYVAGCLVIPDMVAWGDLCYVNEIEPRLMEVDRAEVYVASLLIRGGLLAAPQMVLAVFGGLAYSSWRSARSRRRCRAIANGPRPAGPIG